MVTFSGVMPANILPFKADLSIDEPAYRAHLRWLADTRGVTGIVANGHAAEVSSLSRDERKRSLAVALDEVGSACPIVAGVYSDGTAEAVELARDAKALGAAAVLVFPPTLFMWGAQLKPDIDRKSTRLNSSHGYISYAVFCLKKKKTAKQLNTTSSMI